MDNNPSSSFNSFLAYTPQASVLQSPHEIESLASKLQKTTLQEAPLQAPLPPGSGNQCFNSTRPPVYPLPPQLKQAVTDYLEQVHGGGLEYFDSPMLQNYLEKVIQEALRQVAQARTPPHPTLSELRVAGPPEAKFELGVSPEGLAEEDRTKSEAHFLTCHRPTSF